MQANPLFGKLSSPAQREEHIKAHHAAGLVDTHTDSVHGDNDAAAAELEQLRTFGPEGIQCVCTCVPTTVAAKQWTVAKLKAELTARKV